MIAIMRAIRWLGRLLIARRTAIVVSILALIICTAGISLYVADKIYAARHDNIADMDARRYALSIMAIGTRSRSDFKGVRYWAPPILTICPRSDEKWDGSLTWGGAIQPTNKERGRIFSVGPSNTHGELIVILPKDTMDIHLAETSRDIVDIFEAKELVQFEHNYVGASLKVAERGAHREISFNPFSTVIKTSETAYSLSTVKFTLPSSTVRRNGFGSWEFQMPFAGRFPGLFSSGLGSAEFDPKSGPASGSYSKPRRTEHNSEFAVRMCRKDAGFQAELLDPPPARVGSAYEWPIPFGNDWQLTGQISGGNARRLVDASLPVSFAILTSLLGALYGIALARNTEEHDSDRNEVRPPVLSGRARQEDQPKSQVKRSVESNRMALVKPSKRRSKRRRR